MLELSAYELVTDTSFGIDIVVVFVPPINTTIPITDSTFGNEYEVTFAFAAIVNPPLFVKYLKLANDIVDSCVDELTVSPPAVTRLSSATEVISEPVVLIVTSLVTSARFGMDSVVVDAPAVNTSVPPIFCNAGNEYVVIKLHTLRVILFPTNDINGKDTLLSAGEVLIVNPPNTDVNCAAEKVVVLVPPVNVTLPDTRFSAGKSQTTSELHALTIISAVPITVVSAGNERVSSVDDEPMVTPPHTASAGKDTAVIDEPVVFIVIIPDT